MRDFLIERRDGFTLITGMTAAGIAWITLALAGDGYPNMMMHGHLTIEPRDIVSTFDAIDAAGLKW